MIMALMPPASATTTAPLMTREPVSPKSTRDRKSTRLNSSHSSISYAVFCLKKKMRERRRRHNPGRVIRDLAVLLADGGDCLSDLRAVRNQAPLFGPVASDTTVFRLIDLLVR